MAAYRGIFGTWSNIYNEAFFEKIPNDFKLLTKLLTKAPSQMFDWVKNRLLAINVNDAEKILKNLEASFIALSQLLLNEQIDSCNDIT